MSMPSIMMIGFLAFNLLLSAGASAQVASRSTETIGCYQVAAGQSVRKRTSEIESESKKFRAYATVELRRDSADVEARRCAARWSLFLIDGDSPARLIKEVSETTEDYVAAAVIGYSPNGSKLAADFILAAGDYTGHRAIILDLKSSEVRYPALEEQITNQLPSCDYFQTFEGVTDTGEAIFHVPKSIYVQEGLSRSRQLAVGPSHGECSPRWQAEEITNQVFQKRIPFWCGRRESHSAYFSRSR